MIRTAESFAQQVHTKDVCEALNTIRASYYYCQRRRNDLSCKRTSSTPHPALSEREQQPVRYESGLHRFIPLVSTRLQKERSLYVAILVIHE
ncbi:MAG: hypothetical protein HRU72_11580 [Planctomycetia bacterium]|uniref:hypothetical protein n=1 Tax=Candidatus Brocadia sapporoensis TaxID=392547 RepID=UPI001177CC59|nr:hypothetical protein [Candidatus Brocadia sapporoensis]MCC7239253.1 hypothetical protein [Candidatus Brocadia sp.]QOJ07132.1 MAG: hypothetical protein HRU72_11580 [Planctomycetia bacterium]HQU32289.1 hypothetical protein [Candidatus Brocadia sapporoensis]